MARRERGRTPDTSVPGIGTNYEGWGHQRREVVSRSHPGTSRERNSGLSRDSLSPTVRFGSEISRSVPFRRW
jgi:hypothetical protein